MADLSFYKYLKAAFRDKLYTPKWQIASFKTKYPGFGYNLTFDQIFIQARKILPTFYTNKFDNTEEGNLAMAKKVLEKLDLKQDKELERKFEGFNIAEDQQAIQEAKEQSEAVEQPAGTMAGGGHIPSLPSAPSIRFTSPTLKGELRSGMTGGTGTGTAATNKAAGLTGKGTAATNKFARFQREYIGPATAKAARIAGSKAGLFFQRNIGKYLTLGRMATVASAGIGAFAGAALGGAGAWAGGIAGAALPSWVKSGGAGRFFGKAGNGVINFGARLSNQVGKGGFKLAGPKKKIGLIFLGSFLLFGLAAGFLGAINPGSTPTTPGTPIGLGGDISQCTFYRSGDGTSSDPSGGLKFNIPQWSALINEIASKASVPPAALAALARVECPNCFATKDPSYITNDYDTHYSTVEGKPFAYGVMQFYPPTFENTFAINKEEMKSLFGKTEVKTTIDSPDNKAPDNVLRIYSVKDSLIAAAFKIKKDVGSSPPYDRAAIERIVKAYFTQCTYTQGGKTHNYCDDVEKGINSCKVITITTTTTAGSHTTINVSAPSYIASKEELINYDISVTYTGTGTADIIITNAIPDQAEFVAASIGGGHKDKRVSWFKPNVASGQTVTVSLILRALIDKGIITNVVEAAGTPSANP